MLLFCLLSVLAAVTPIRSFNIDTKTPYILYGNFGEYFGFSVALHKHEGSRKLLVGAPKAQTSQEGVESGGTVYQCNIPTNLQTPRQPVRCSSRIDTFDDKGNKYMYIDGGGFPETNPDGSVKYNYEYRGYQQENKTEQWMGVTLKSTGDNVVACAHRYVNLAYYYKKPDQPFDTQPVGKCSLISGDLASLESVYIPCATKTTGYEQTSCQAGTSASLSNGALVFGGPGAGKGLGKVFLAPDFNSENTINTGRHGEHAGQWYTGYSVTICDVNGDGREETITAAPRADTYMGKLFVYSKNGNVLNKQKELSGSQIGEYFGYSMDCGDVNGDGLGDVIVGAPFYSRDTSGQARLQATGRVYVFYGEPDNYLKDEPTIIDGEIYERARFGHSVKSVGKMNGDKYDDVMIGAPYNANGIVYLYLGSSKGLETDFSQAIRPNDLGVQANQDTFGYSIDGGVDMDNNDYPDVLIGTMDGFATYLRALPIIDLNATIQITPNTPIDTESEVGKVNVPDEPSYQAVAVDVKICFRYIKGIVEGSTQDIVVNYTLTSDYRNPKGFRMYFKPSRDTAKSQRLSGTVTVSTSGDEICTSIFKSYFNSEIYDKRHIYFKLDADVKDETFFDKRVTLNQKMIESAEERVVLQSGCIKPSGICQADLVLSPVDYTISPKGWDAIALGRTDYVLFNINVTNKGEDAAFVSELTVVLPSNVIFNRRQAIGDQKEEEIGHIKCITKQQDDGDNMVICALRNQLEVGASEIFGISVITSGIENLAQKKLVFEFNAHVQEPSEELNTLLGDNVREVAIAVGYPADIELRGRPLRERQPYNNDRKLDGFVTTAKSIGPDVRHELEVTIKENSDEERFDNVQLLVKWPMVKFGTKDDYLLYLVHVAIEDERPDNSRCKTGGVVNPKNVEDKSIGKQKRSAEYADGPTQSCVDDESSCVQFYCEIDVLKKGDVVNFRFMARLWESTLYGVGNINVTSYVTVASVKQPNFVFGPEAKSDMKSQFYPSSATKRNYLWIIVGSVIAGILLLVLIVIILWKCGFFKRKAPPTHKPEAHEDEGDG